MPVDEPEPLQDNQAQNHVQKPEHPSRSKTASSDSTPLDISAYASDRDLRTGLSDEQRYTLISGRKPESSYQFPGREFTDTRRKSGLSVRFCKHEWLEKYDFLTYSKSQDGLYCIVCMLFPIQTGQSGRAKGFVETPYIKWKNCLEDVEKHSALTYHKKTAAKMTAFLATHTNQKQRIDFSLSAAEKERVARNRAFLLSILKCVEFCGRQGIALRGHRDDETNDSLNKGNFKALIDFRIEAGDQELKHHMETCMKNASYVSKTSQNELLLCVKDYLQAKIVQEIKDQKIGINYAILADEVSDIANWEQLGLVLRYVKDESPVEKLIEFVPCESITGEAIHTQIKESLQKIALDPADCRAQGYNGAGNMAGRLRGCAARFRQEVPRAVYRVFSRPVAWLVVTMETVGQTNQPCVTTGYPPYLTIRSC